MDLRKLKSLIDLVSDSNISELEITEAEGKIRIVKSDPLPAAPTQTVYMHAPAVAPTPPVAPPGRPGPVCPAPVCPAPVGWPSLCAVCGGLGGPVLVSRLGGPVCVRFSGG